MNPPVQLARLQPRRDPPGRWRPGARIVSGARGVAVALFALGTMSVAANVQTNLVTPSPPLPDMSFSVLRVFGALALVVALFLGGVWLFRNWQRVVVRKGAAAQLTILESKSLGNRHALYVVGYEQQRLLLAASPSGVTLVSHLPSSESGVPAGPSPNFSETLQRMVNHQA